MTERMKRLVSDACVGGEHPNAYAAGKIFAQSLIDQRAILGKQVSNPERLRVALDDVREWLGLGRASAAPEADPPQRVEFKA